MAMAADLMAGIERHERADAALAVHFVRLQNVPLLHTALAALEVLEERGFGLDLPFECHRNASQRGPAPEFP